MSFWSRLRARLRPQRRTLPSIEAWRRPLRVVPPHVPAPPVPDLGGTLEAGRALVRFDPDRPYERAPEGVLVQRAVIDVLLADGRMTRVGVVAHYEPSSPSEPLRLLYHPLQDLVTSEIVS